MSLPVAPEHAFPTLAAEEVEALRLYGKAASYKKDEAVWTAGEADVCMFVVVRGGIQVVDGRTHRPIVRHGEGNFSGDIDVITGRPSMVSAIAAEDSELLVMRGDCVRHIVAERPGIGEKILRAFLVRRAIMQQGGLTGVLVVGSRYSAETLHLRESLARSRVPTVWQDVESDPDAGELSPLLATSPDVRLAVAKERGGAGGVAHTLSSKMMQSSESESAGESPSTMHDESAEDFLYFDDILVF